MKNLRSPIVWLIWSLSTVLWVAHPFIMMKYLEVTQRLGWYPPEADSIGIPIVGGFLLAIVGYPVMFVLCRKATRCLTTPFSLFRWDTSRPWRSALVSLVFFALVASSIHSALHSRRLLDEIRASQFSQMQDAAVYRMVFSLGWVALWLVLRSCFMTAPNRSAAPNLRSESSVHGS